jgi:hypothetical protein
MPTSSTPNPTPTIYTTGPVPTDDLRVGDVIAIESAPWTLTYGPIVAIKPYRSTVAPHPDWRYAVFANGVEITMTPGGAWFPC